MTYLDRIRGAKEPHEQQGAIQAFLVLLSIEMKVKKTLSYLDVENLIDIVCKA